MISVDVKSDYTAREGAGHYTITTPVVDGRETFAATMSTPCQGPLSGAQLDPMLRDMLQQDLDWVKAETIDICNDKGEQ